jgi:DNA-binding transcriptional ArsR family regulator
MTIEQIKELKTGEFFKVLSHEIRAEIISLLHENIEMSYTEILHTLNIEEGNLNFHLRKMKGFVELTEKKNYRLSEYGKITHSMLQGVDEN